MLGGIMLCAVTSPLTAQTPTFAFSSAQILPATETSQPTLESLAIDQAGNLFLANSSLGSVVELPAGSNQLAPVNVKGVSNPLGIAVDGAGNLYIANDSVGYGGQSTSSIIKLTPSGAQSTIASGWISPVAIAVDLAGDVYVVEANVNFTGASGVFMVGRGSGTRVQLNFNGLISPSGIAIDPLGNVYVTDSDQGTITELAASSTAQTTLVTGISSAGGIATDLAGNLFYNNGNEIDEIPAGGSTPIVAYSVLNSPGYFSPEVVPTEGLAVDMKGDLTFAATDGGDESYFVARTQRASVNFGSAEICVPGWTSVSACNTTQTLWLGTAGAITPGVRFMSGGVPNKDFVATYAANACTPQTLSAGDGCPVNVTFSPKYSGSRSAVMQLLDSNGKVQSSTNVYGLGIGPQVVFNSAVQSTVGTGNGFKAIAVDGADNVFVANPAAHNVLEFPAGGGTSKAIGSFLITPVAVAVDAQGNVYIADSDGNQVVKVAPDGTQFHLGNNLANPLGVALDNAGNVYIADADNNRVVKVASLSGYATIVPGNWTIPQSVTVDSEGNVYALDGPGVTNPKVWKLTISTGVSTVIGSGFIQPCGLAVDAAGNAYVGDSDINAVVEVPVNGGPQVNLGTGILDPCGVALDAGGNVFVADSGNDRILKIARTQAPSLSFASTHVGATSTDSPKPVQIANVGNAPLVAAGGLTNGTNFAQVAYSGAGTDCTEALWLDPGSNCEISFSFKPTLAGPLASSDLLASNANPDSTLIGLKGTGTDVATTITNVGGSGQTAVYGAGFAAPLRVLVQDGSGAGVANATVSFTGVGIKFASSTVHTNASGYASVMASAAGVGSITATAKVTGVTTPATFKETGTKATLTVTATTFAWELNQAFPLTQYLITGLVNGDTVTGAPVLSTTAHVGSPVGFYPISASKGTLVIPASYTVVYESGELIIDTPATVTVYSGLYQSSPEGTAFVNPLKSIVVGTSHQPLGGVPITYTSTDIKFSSKTSTTSVSGTASVTATPTAVGSVVATATVTGTTLSTNFNETGTAAAALRTAASQIVPANNMSNSHLTPPSSATYTITGLIDGDDPTVGSGDPSQTTPPAVVLSPGTYPTNITQANHPSPN
jgi:sugar lactone lactonase YvrE